MFTTSCVPKFGAEVLLQSKWVWACVIILVIFSYSSFSVLDAGVETQEINETQLDETEQVNETGADDNQGQVEEGSEGCGMRPVSSLSTSEYSVTETPSDGESCSQTAVVDENEAVQLGRKRREQFSETLAGYKQKRLKKKLPADAQMLHFAEKELELKERMFRQLESTSQEQTKTMNMVTTQVKELTNAMTGTLMLLQQTYQRPPTPQFPYHQYGSPYLSPSHPMMPVPQRTHQSTTPAQHSPESNADVHVYNSQPLLE